MTDPNQLYQLICPDQEDIGERTRGIFNLSGLIEIITSLTNKLQCFEITIYPIRINEFGSRVESPLEFTFTNTDRTSNGEPQFSLQVLYPWVEEKSDLLFPLSDLGQYIMHHNYYIAEEDTYITD